MSILAPVLLGASGPVLAQQITVKKPVVDPNDPRDGAPNLKADVLS